MKKSKILLVSLIAAVSILIVSISIVFISKAVLSNRLKNQFYFELTKVDALISSGNYLDAASYFVLIKEPPKNIEFSMAFLKRAYQISKGLKDYSYLKNSAKRAYENNAPVSEITACYLYALLRCDEVANAFKLAKELKNSSYSTLVAESYLRAAKIPDLTTLEGILSEQDIVLLSLQDFDEEKVAALIPIYEAAVESSSDIRLIKNLALLYLASGDFGKAFAIASSRLKTASPLLYIEAGFDASEYDEILLVIDLLLQNASSNSANIDSDYLEMLKADIYIMQGKNREAAFLYKTKILEGYSKSVAPYKNLLTLSLTLDADTRAELELRDEDLYKIYFTILDDKEPYSDFYSSDIELILGYCELLSRLNKNTQALNFLSRFVQNNLTESDIHLQLLYHSLTDSKKIDYYISQLEFLLHKDPNNEIVAQTLIYYLIAFPDRTNQLQIILSMCEKNFIYSEWIEQYKALANTLNSSLSGYEAALTIYKTLFNKYQKYEYAQNVSEIMYFLSKLDSALEYANLAETRLLSLSPNKELTASDANKELKAAFSKIKSLQGRIQEKQENSFDAINSYRSALTYDPSNIDAILALQRLKKE